jgi:hypothetical protein
MQQSALTVSQVARILGVAEGTVRRRDAELKPQRTPLGRLYDPTVIALAARGK